MDFAITLRELPDNANYSDFDIERDEEIMIYGFIVRMKRQLNLLDLFENFKSYASMTGMKVTDSFQFTRWFIEEEKVAFQDMRSNVANVDNLRKFWKFQDNFLNQNRR
jgi:hypothetical protein